MGPQNPKTTTAFYVCQRYTDVTVNVSSQVKSSVVRFRGGGTLKLFYQPSLLRWMCHFIYVEIYHSVRTPHSATMRNFEMNLICFALSLFNLKLAWLQALSFSKGKTILLDSFI